MDEIVVALLEEALSGISISIPIYANVVPVHGTFPCMRYELMATNPFHTKDGTTADKYYLKVDFISKQGGLIGSELKSSAFDYVYSGAIELIRFLESYQPSGDLVGFRVNNIVTDFEFESNVFYITFDLDLFINKTPQVTMFSIEPAKVGTDTIGGKQVWVRGGIFDKDDFVDAGGNSYIFDTLVNPSTITILEKVAHYYIDGVPTGRNPVPITVGDGGTLIIRETVFSGPKPEISKGSFFIWYTID